MAKFNQGNFYGLVLREPTIIIDEATGQFKTGYVPIMLIRGTRESGSDGISDIRYDAPIVFSGDARIIEEMRHWQTNDMVEIKGVITTRSIVKKAKCPICGTVNRIEGCTLTFITPIFATRRETKNSKEEGILLLKKNVDISNQVTLLGYLVTDPDYFRTPHGVDITQYPIAVNRKYRIKDDDPNTRVDFPWIKSFNKVAREDAKRLKKSAMVLIDGMLQTRDVVRKSMCNKCEEEFEWADSAVEIISYSTEYLGNCYSDDELQEQENKKAEDLANDILA